MTDDRLLRSCSVIVSTRDRHALVIEAVRSVLNGKKVPAECIVVDQSTERNSELEAIEDPDCEVRVIRSATTGLSTARNIGIAAAKNDIVALADDDVLVDRSWLESLVDTLDRAGDRIVVSGKVVAGQPETLGAVAPSVTPDIEHATFSGRLNRDPLCGGNCATYRSTFADVGPFDERLGIGARFRSAEDNDMAYRLLDAGYRIVTDPDAVMVHRAWRAGGDARRVRWRYGIGQGAFYVKHLSLHDRWMLARMLADLNGKNPFRRGRDLIYTAGLLWGAVRWAAEERLAPRLCGRASGG